MLSEDFWKQVQQCDTLFTDMDTVGDCQISQEEFRSYIKKRNPEKDDFEEISKKFKTIDTSKDGYISFLEMLRSVCEDSHTPMPSELSIYDKLQIYESIEYRHITPKEKASVSKELEALQSKFGESTGPSMLSIGVAATAIVGGVLLKLWQS